MPMIIDSYDEGDDIVGTTIGPFSEIRRKLWEIGSMVLPDPILGFRNPEDEKKSQDIINRFNSRYIHTIEEIAA